MSVAPTLRKLPYPDTLEAALGMSLFTFDALLKSGMRYVNSTRPILLADVARRVVVFGSDFFGMLPENLPRSACSHIESE